MRAEIKHFKNYKSQIEFCSDILSSFDGKNILLLGDTIFINDILNINKDNIELIEYDDVVEGKVTSSLETSEYLYALVEEDSIKELNKFKGKIKCTAYILHNDEDNKILNKINNENECKNCENCGKCDEYIDEEVNDVLDQYLDILNYIDIDDYDSKKEILFELANAFYNAGSITTKTAIANKLIDSAEDDMNNLENYSE